MSGRKIVALLLFVGVVTAVTTTLIVKSYALVGKVHRYHKGVDVLFEALPEAW